LLKIRAIDGELHLDDGGGLVNSFLPVSATNFEARDADRGFTLQLDQEHKVTNLHLRLITDEMDVQPIGPLIEAATTRTDPDPTFTRKMEACLKAMWVGGKALDDALPIAYQAKRDFGHGSPELTGLEPLTFVAVYDVEAERINRHGAAVKKVYYYRVPESKSRRGVLIYVTAEGLVTDEDLID
jgi:hypothetical protein